VRERSLYSMRSLTFSQWRFENESDMRGFRSHKNSMSKRVLDLLELVKLIVWKIVIDRVMVIEFRMDNRGGNGAGCFDVEIWADTAIHSRYDL